MALAKHLQPLARLATKALGINHYEIRYEMYPDLPENHAGLCYHQPDYYLAHIDLAVSDQPLAEQGRSLLHELLHVAVYELDTAATDVINMVHEDDQAEAMRIYRRAQEQTVERIARSLYPVLMRSISNANKKS